MSKHVKLTVDDGTNTATYIDGTFDGPITFVDGQNGQMIFKIDLVVEQVSVEEKRAKLQESVKAVSEAIQKSRAGNANAPQKVTRARKSA